MAQDSAPPQQQDEEGYGSDDIVVTATKRSESLQKVPLSITAFSSEEMERKGYTNLAGVQESTPNLNFSVQSAGQNVVRVTLRGVGTETLVGGGDPGVALHIDGVYVGRNSAAATDIFDIERVEVLRGPQGTLYGRNATGGSINIITKKPTADRVEGSADFTYGNYNELRVRGVVNVPLSDTLSSRIAVFGEAHDGYLKNLYPSGRDNNDKETFGGRFQLRWQPSAGADILLRGYFQKFGGAGPGSRYLGTDIVSANGYPTQGNVGIGTGGQRVGADVFNLARTRTGAAVLPRPTGFYEVRKDAPEFVDLLIKGADLEADIDLSDTILLRSTSSYQTNTNEILVDSDNSELPIETRYRKNDASQFSQEFNLLSQTQSPFQWLFGAYFYREELTERFQTIVPAGLIPTTIVLPAGAVRGGGGVQQDRVVNHKTESYALFGQLSYELTPGLVATAGLRHTWDNKVQDRTGGGQIDITTGIRATTPGLIGYEPPSHGEASFAEFTYRFSLAYEFARDHNLFASYSRGYKSGGFDFNGGVVDPVVGQVPYKPEFVDAIEVGSKNRFLDRRVTLNLTGFHYKYKDLQVFRLTGDGPLTDNAAQSTIWGIEGELKLQPTDDFAIDGSVGYLNATYDSYSIPTPPTDFSGNRLNYAPKWTAAAGAEYTMHFGEDALIARIDWSYRSATYFDRANLPLDRQDAYSLFNGRLRYNLDAWYIDLWGRNLTKTEYLTGQLINPPFNCNCRTVNLGAPRTYGVTVGTRF
ncbi:TonB-dependent receptor [Sphingomonas canadensis]|nr:TonB-dependent receptor [Sphingomonas canadensis]